MSTCPPPSPDCACPAAALHWVIGLLESWLRQASDEVRDQLAEFAYGPEAALDRVEELIELIGLTATRLRLALPSTTPGQDR